MPYTLVNPLAMIGTIPKKRLGGPTGPWAGMTAEGNIDLTNRPQVRNPDGSISSVRSTSFGFDDGEVLVPTVSEDGRIMSEQEALKQYRDTGRNLGKFQTADQANAYAQALHEAQAAYKPGQQQSPAPMQPQAAPQAGPMGPSPFAAPVARPRMNLLANAVDGFQRGFDPQGWQAGKDQAKADQAEAQKKQIALMQNIKALPLEQRMRILPQLSQQIGRPIPPDLMQDQAIDEHLALMMGQAGMAPEAPDYQFLQGPDGAISLGNKGTGEVVQKVPGTPTPPKPADPVKWETVSDRTGAMYQVNPITGEKRPIGITGRVPGSEGGSSARFENLSPAQMEAMGYPKGTIGQRNTTTGEIQVKSRPSASQTGQPTEGERSAALHAQISMHGLDKLTEMEGRGYNRAGVGEQIGGVIGGITGRSENERLYDQAAAEFIDGYLRAMTGAAATENEIKTYRAQWFPQWGDTAPVIAQKAEGRLEALRAMKSKVGRAWKPEWDQTMAALGGGAQPSPEQMAASPYLQGFSPEMQKGMVAMTAKGKPAPQASPEDAFIDSLFPDENGDGGPDGPPEGSGLSQQEWDLMPPEDKALFQ